MWKHQKGLGAEGWLTGASVLDEKQCMQWRGMNDQARGMGTKASLIIFPSFTGVVDHISC